MKVKRFVYRNIFLSILIIGSLYLLSYYFTRYVNDRTVKYFQYDKLKDNSVEIVSLGSSHGKFGLNLYNENQMNLALESQRFYYDLKILEKYGSKIKEEAIVIIPISIFSFYENDEFFQGETYKNYINILERKTIKKKLGKIEYWLIRNFSVIYPPERLISTIKYGINHGNKKNMIFYNKNIRNKALSKEAKDTAMGHTKNLKKEYEKNGTKSLIKLLNYIEKNNYNSVIIITPYWHEYIEELNKIEKDIFFNRIYKILEDVKVRTNKKYIFLDYSYDKRFLNNVEYFMDDDHLNEKGAEYFTKILLKDIEKELKNENKI